MAIPIKHVQSRDGVYYYVRRVPKIVLETPGAIARFFDGQHTVRVSLHTKDPLVAARKAEAHEAEFQQKVSAALDRSALSQPRRTRKVTTQDIENVREHRRWLAERNLRQLVFLREMGGPDGEYATQELDSIEMDAEQTLKVLVEAEPSADPRLDVDAITRELIEVEGFDAPPGSDAFLLLRRAVREGELEGRRDGFDVVYGRKPLIQSQATNPAAPTISTVIGAYIQRQKNPRTIVGIREAERRFIAIVGDFRLDQLKAEHFRSFCAAEASGDVGGKSRGSVRRPRSPGTIQKKLTFLNAAINHAISIGSFAGPNPASGISVEAFTRPVAGKVMPAKRPFELSELSSILAYPWFTGCKSATNIHAPGDHQLGGMWYWGPVMAMLTGCRASELGGLALDEIMLGDPFPHILIRNNKFRTTKGGYARKVPILDQLLELGFAEFVDHQRKQKVERLFDDWKPPRGRSDDADPAWSNGKMVRAFNTTLVPAVMKGRLLPGARREVTFHSFRGAFKTLLHLQRYGIKPNYINEVVGHSKDGLDKRYIGEIPIEETYPAVRGCRYEGLLMPSAPPLP